MQMFSTLSNSIFLSQLKPGRRFIDRLGLTVLVALAITFAFISLVPYLFNGFYADDSLNSQVATAIARLGSTPFDYAMNINRQWMTGPGRFYPLGWLIGNHFFYFFHELVVARFVHVCTVMLNIVFFIFILTKWTRSRCLWIIFLPLLLALFQMRDFFDPISSYSPFMQTILFSILGSTYCLSRFLETKKAGFLALSCLCYGAGLLTYEIPLTMLPFILALPFFYGKGPRTTAMIGLPFVILSGLYLIAVFYLRSTRQFSYPGTEISNDLSAFFRAYWYQITAALPLAYFRANQELTIDTIKQLGMHSVSAKISVMLGVTLFTGGLWRSQSERSSNMEYSKVAFLGMSLILLPAVLVAISMRWQQALGPGLGYLPVYFSYFGVALLFALGGHRAVRSRIFRRLPTLLRALAVLMIGVGLGLILFINHASNQYVAEKMDLHYKYPRTRVEQAMANGVADQMTASSIIVTPQSYQWLNIDLSDKIARKTDRIVLLSDYAKEGTHPTLSEAHFLDFGEYPGSSTSHYGWVFFSKMTQLPNSNEVQFQYGRIYSDTPSERAKDVSILCGESKVYDFTSQGKTVREVRDFVCQPGEVKIRQK